MSMSVQALPKLKLKDEPILRALVPHIIATVLGPHSLLFGPCSSAKTVSPHYYLLPTMGRILGRRSALVQMLKPGAIEAATEEGCRMCVFSYGDTLTWSLTLGSISQMSWRSTASASSLTLPDSM